MRDLTVDIHTAAGPVRAQYRRYNISGIEPGDDYAAMRQAIDRRFRRAVEEQGVLPDVLLIDGGAGQLAQAQAALADLGVEGVADEGEPQAKDEPDKQAETDVAHGVG